MEPDVSDVKTKMQVWRLSRLVANYPYAVLLAILLFSSTCLIVPLTTKQFPNFSDPQLGFEARGTEVAQRLTAWQNLMQSTKSDGELIDNPLEYYYHLLAQSNRTRNRSKNAKTRVKPSKNKQKTNQNGKKYKQKLKENITEDHTEDKWQELKKLKIRDDLDEFGYHKDRFFCNAPSSAYSRVVLGSKNEDSDLWTIDGVLAQCKIDALIRENPEFTSICETQTDLEGKVVQQINCCRSWTPANYVALMSNRTSCLGVTESDLSRVEAILRRCSHFYHNLELTANCANDLMCQRRVPSECWMHNAPYNLLHFLLDQSFMPSDASANRTNATLRSIMMFLPFAASSATFDFYKNLNFEALSDGPFRVLAMELGLKNTLFDRLLLSDSFLLLVGFIFITICIWIYTGSLIVTAAAICAVVFSLGISYAFYTMVLRIQFFPFMNLLAIVVAIGIGADDAFIFCKVWNTNKQQKLSNGDTVKLLHDTMRQAIPPMFVTSLTTAVAFFASIVSNVTAINCFSIFSGVTVMVNFGLMVTWIPASVIISSRRPSFLSPANFIARKFIRPLKMFTDKITLGFSHFLKFVTINLRWLWLLGLGTVAVMACLVVFLYPALQLPDSPNFQLFDGSHCFEKYDFIYAKRFWFEKVEMIDSSDVLPLRFVWGVKPLDNGNFLDPAEKGTLEADETFDITDPQSQLWLQQFCRDLRSQPFYRSTSGPLLPNCFIDSLYNFMQRRCDHPFKNRISMAPCCESSKFPYTPEVLKRCSAEATYNMYITPAHLWNPGGVATGGIKFSKESISVPSQEVNSTSINPIEPTIKAVIVEYDSTQLFSLSYAEMDKFFHQVESWMQKQLESAPPGMRNGWFVSRFEFYELQRTLYKGTLWAIGVSMSLALVVLIFVTLNILISFYAIVTISAAIIVTIAGLVLLGWNLNVLESVAVSTAIGLAVDFSLHYAVSYKTCVSDDRIIRVKTALEQMGGPTLMACVTTGAAGAFMLPSRVLAYIQIGVFLLLIMGVSWCYATFFLCPLLSIIGPSPKFAQFRYPRLRFLLSLCEVNSDDSFGTDNLDGMNRRRYWDGMSPRGRRESSTGTMYQLHCGELESLSVRPPSPLLPTSPSSNLLQLDARYVDVQVST